MREARRQVGALADLPEPRRVKAAAAAFATLIAAAAPVLVDAASASIPKDGMAIVAGPAATPGPNLVGALAPASAPTPPTDWRTSPLLIPLLSGLFSLVGSWLAVYVGLRNTRSTIHQKANEAELAAIEAKLGVFYGPYLQRSEENFLLATDFHARQPPGFRTLVSLLDPAWRDGLTPSDRTIVAELVANGTDLRAMIRGQSGAVDPLVRPYLARARAHFTMLILASQGALENDPARFARYVYPRQLDRVLQADMDRLRARAELLRRRPFADHPRMDAFVLPAGCDLAPWTPAPWIADGIGVLT